jgi:hypothetical protein
MVDRYIVTATGIKNGVPYSSLLKIIKGTKDNGDRYEFANSDVTIREAEEIPVGTVLNYSMSRVSANATSSAVK